MGGCQLKKRIYVISILICFFDQFLKHLVTTNLVYQETRVILPHFFYLRYIKNTGGAWSILASNTGILILIGIFCLFGFGYYIQKKKEFTKIEVIFWGFLLGGILGNLIDRIFYHGVIDYLGFILLSYYFPIFNFADIAIVCGCFLMGIELVGDEYGKRK